MKTRPDSWFGYLEPSPGHDTSTRVLEKSFLHFVCCAFLSFGRREGMHLRPREGRKDESPFSPLEKPKSAFVSNPIMVESRAMVKCLPTLRRAWPRDGPEAAMCVQGVDVQCVLQFTLIHAAGCALHRRTSRVIHRLELSCQLLLRSRWGKAGAAVVGTPPIFAPHPPERRIYMYRCYHP